jgi:MYXO-CTERM domain-containing protein
MKTPLFALCLLVSSLPGVALACSCMEPGATFLTAPQDGAVDVPPNALVWVGGSATRGLFAGEERFPIELIGPDDLPVPGVEGRLSSSFDVVDVFTPDAELEAGTTYRVVVNGAVQSTFTTGSEPDHEAPDVPDEAAITTWSDPPVIPDGASCGTGRASHGISVEWQMGDRVLILLDRDGVADVDVELVQGQVPALSNFGFASLGSGFACGGDNWSEAAHGAKTDLSYGGFDIAGNFSGWSEPETVTVRTRAGCDASGSGQPLGLAGLLVLGGLVGLRRRG